MELVVIFLSVHICNFVFSLLSRSKPVLIPTLIVALCLINNNIRVLIWYQGGVFSWPKIGKPLTRLYGQPKRKLIDDNPLKKIKTIPCYNSIQMNHIQHKGFLERLCIPDFYRHECVFWYSKNSKVNKSTIRKLYNQCHSNSFVELIHNFIGKQLHIIMIWYVNKHK